jgi:nucleotide-binding universal stress UspA family protein
MIRISKILVPVDFSEYSELALNYACELAQKFGAELHVLNVIEDNTPSVSEAALAYPAFQEYFHTLKQDAESKIASLPGPSRPAPARVVRHVLLGRPYKEITHYAAEHEVDLVIMGTHGRTGIAHWFLGSVAEMVVRKAPCPVLTIPKPGRT